MAVLGRFAFLGNFLFIISDALVIFLPMIGGIVGAFTLASLVGTASEKLLRRLGNTAGAKIFSVVMAVLAGAILLGLLASFVVWLFELSNPWSKIGLAATIGGILFGSAAVVVAPDRPMPTGMIIYYTSRMILNTLRSIEPLIMCIVFVVWVGIGPFAGVLALTLHTIASLGKLYSEQVENIAEGPIEAITATGANRLQTIIYAVMPQIVPPYIAFTIYRWDINIRMSTIIGFAGGGGIGFLLQQNLNLLKYRQASVQMIAIAIVVATLDYISAKIRERIV
jgi:phosphonate ABC transporter permease subunit PhnE